MNKTASFTLGLLIEALILYGIFLAMNLANPSDTNESVMSETNMMD